MGSPRRSHQKKATVKKMVAKGQVQPVRLQVQPKENEDGLKEVRATNDQIPKKSVNEVALCRPPEVDDHPERK